MTRQREINLCRQSFIKRYQRSAAHSEKPQKHHATILAGLLGNHQQCVHIVLGPDDNDCQLNIAASGLTGLGLNGLLAARFTGVVEGPCPIAG